MITKKKALNQYYTLFLLLSCCLVACQHEADNYAIKGIDVSHYQKRINWNQVAENKDLHFVFIKASEGVSYQDSIFEINWEGAKQANLRRGAYHFFRPNVSVEQQITNFTNKVILQKGDLPPVLDIEDVGEIPLNLLVERVHKWLVFVEDYYHIRPIIYTSLDLYEICLQANFPDHVVWIARYNRLAPPLEMNWKFWQYTNKQQLQGIEEYVDMNVFSGTKAQLNELCIP